MTDVAAVCRKKGVGKMHRPERGAVISEAVEVRA